MAQFYPDGMVHEENYAETMNNVVVPEMNSIRQDRMVPGKNGNQLFVSVFPAPQPKATVIIVHGFTENVDKYLEVIYALNKAGYTVAMHDARGHGRSYRSPGLETTADTYVEHFDDYIEDLEILLKTVYKDLPHPWYLLCHSMGGAVGALFLEKHQDVFDKAVLTSPMIAPFTGMPVWAAQGLASTMRALGKGKKRIMMSKGYQGHEDFDTSCATSRPRFDWYDDLKYREPAFQNSSATYGWVAESVAVTKRILKAGAVEKITTPSLVLQASLDNTVCNGPMDEFAKRLKNGKKIIIEGARHEIFRSIDKDACKWMDSILAFYAT